MICRTLNGNALHLPLADKSVQTCITSPPYWGLRDYGVDDALGLEQTPQQFIANMVNVFREVHRVLKDDGCIWVNMGDSYASGATGRNDAGRNFTGGGGNILGSGNPGNSQPIDIETNLPKKNLIGMPWRLALALQDDGWILRSDIIWAKPNPMPESVTDRPTKSHEYVFLLAKQQRYYYDADAVREAVNSDNQKRLGIENAKGIESKRHTERMKAGKITGGHSYNVAYSNPKGRNKRTVWTVATAPYSGSHFATFPPKLIEPMILAGSKPGDTVLDPFAGTSTVGTMAIRHNRSFVGIELNPDYIKLAQKRTATLQPMLIGVG